MKYVLIFGNPLEGFIFHGPFDSVDQAFDWGHRHNPTNSVLWVDTLHAPEGAVAVPVADGYFDELENRNFDSMSDDETAEDIDRLLSDDA